MARQKSNDRTKGARISRGQLAHEIARMMWEYQIEDFKLAKDKIAKRMNLRHAELPDNLEITHAFNAYGNLFAANEVKGHRQRLLGSSCRLMAEIVQFDPRLVGFEPEAVTTLHRKLDIHVFCDQPESLDIFLHEQGYDYELEDKRFRFGQELYETRPCYQFAYEDIDVSLSVFRSGARNQVPLSPVSGKPMQRMSRQRVEQMLELS